MVTADQYPVQPYPQVAVDHQSGAVQAQPSYEQQYPTHPLAPTGPAVHLHPVASAPAPWSEPAQPWSDPTQQVAVADQYAVRTDQPYSA